MFAKYATVHSSEVFSGVVRMVMVRIVMDWGSVLKVLFRCLRVFGQQCLDAQIHELDMKSSFRKY